MATTICWKGTHSSDWPAWAAFHREVAAHAGAAKNEEVAQRHDRRAARDAKRAAKAVAS